jgi:hypothetical protein
MQCFDDAESELNSGLERMTAEQIEAATSSHLIRLIDFFFALVLGQGILQFAEVIESPFEANVAVWLALITVYYTVIRSFLAWHAAIEARRYRILVERVRTGELWRVYIDVAIVGLYSYMLFGVTPLIADKGADLSGLLWAFPILFLLYLLWGMLRNYAWGVEEFDPRFLLGFGIAYVLLALGYTLVPVGTLGIDQDAGNIITLAFAFALMAFYRYINFWQESRAGLGWERSTWRGMPKPRWPLG